MENASLFQEANKRAQETFKASRDYLEEDLTLKESECESLTIGN